MKRFVIFVCVLGSACGRTPSRYLGEDHRQILKVENMAKFVSLSFDKRGSSTVKDVTYVGTDGYIYTQEFKDTGFLEGTIRWVPAGESESILRSRALSRWTGSPVNTALPADCQKVLGVDVGYASASERVKNLTYLTNDYRILSKEYRDGFVGRHFEGWLEVQSGSK